MLFGNAFAAYATALALTSGSIPLVPTAIASALSGNVLANQQNVGLALGFDMVIVIAVVMVGYLLLQRRAARWASEAPMRRRRWRVVVLALAAIYFLVPLLSAAEFSLRIPGGGYGVANYLAIARDEALFTALLTSLQIAVITAVLVLAARRADSGVGAAAVPGGGRAAGERHDPADRRPAGRDGGRASRSSRPTWAGRCSAPCSPPRSPRSPRSTWCSRCRSPTGRSTTGSPRSRCARWSRRRATSARGWPSALVRVVLPAIRSAVLGAAFLTLALVLGEIVIARILLYTDTFPVAVVEVGRSAAGVAVALSLASLLLTWVLLLAVSFAGGGRSRSGTPATTEHRDRQRHSRRPGDRRRGRAPPSSSAACGAATAPRTRSTGSTSR